MRRWLIVMGLLLAPLPLSAAEWTATDYTFEAIYLTLHAVDWGQTLNIAQRDDEYHERNLFLGKHPSRGQVNTYFAATALLHVGISALLDPPARNYFQAGTIGMVLVVIGNNYRIGLTVAY